MCTSFRLKADDGAVVIGRTMEFAIDLSSALLAVPVGTTFTGLAPEGSEGATWTTTHGYIGMNAFGSTLVVDGVNDAGLCVGVLYLPGFVGYQEPGPTGNLAPEEVANHLLGLCATIDEVRDAIAQVRVWSHAAAPLGEPLPLHYAVSDRSGRSLVIEHIDGELRLHENPFGVLTNSPSFDWHVTNLRNYTRLTAENLAHIEIDGQPMLPIGQGSGLLGMPGDWTPPSRFVRAIVLSHAAHPGADGPAAAKTANHLIYALDIPLGAIRGYGGAGLEELTQWATITDLTNGQLYVRYYGEPFIHQVSVADALTAAADGPVIVPLAKPDVPWTVPADLSATVPIDPAADRFG